MPLMPVPTRLPSPVSFTTVSHNVSPRELTEVYHPGSNRSVSITLGVFFGILVPCFILSLYYCVCYKRKRIRGNLDVEESFCTNLCNNLAECTMSQHGITRSKCASEVYTTSQIQSDPGYQDTRAHTMKAISKESIGRSQHREEAGSRLRNSFRGGHSRIDRKRPTNSRSSSLVTEHSTRKARKKGGKTRRSEAVVSKSELNPAISKQYIPRHQTNSPPFELAIGPVLAQEILTDPCEYQDLPQSYRRSRPRKGPRTRPVHPQTPSRGTNLDISYPEKSHISPHESATSKPRPLREFGAVNGPRWEDGESYLSEKFKPRGYSASDINASLSSTTSTRLIKPLSNLPDFHQNIGVDSFDEAHGLPISGDIHRDKDTATRIYISASKSTEPRIELKHPGTLVDFGRNRSADSISTVSDTATDTNLLEDLLPAVAVLSTTTRGSTPISSPPTSSLITIVDSLDMRSQNSDDITLDTGTRAPDSWLTSNAPDVSSSSSSPSLALNQGSQPHIPSSVSRSLGNTQIENCSREGLQSSLANSGTAYIPEEVMDYHSSSNSSLESFTLRPYVRALGSPTPSDISSVISMAGYLLGAGVTGHEFRDRIGLNHPASVISSECYGIEHGSCFASTSMPTSPASDYDIICASPSLETAGGHNEMRTPSLPENTDNPSITPLLAELRNINATDLPRGLPLNSSESASNSKPQGHPRGPITPRAAHLPNTEKSSGSAFVAVGSRMNGSQGQTFIPPVTITQKPRNTAVPRTIGPPPERIDTKSTRRRGIKTEELQRVRAIGHEPRRVQGAKQVLVARFPTGRPRYRATVESVADSDDESNGANSIKES